MPGWDGPKGGYRLAHRVFVAGESIKVNVALEVCLLQPTHELECHEGVYGAKHEPVLGRQARAASRSVAVRPAEAAGVVVVALTNICQFFWNYQTAVPSKHARLKFRVQSFPPPSGQPWETFKNMQTKT